MNLDHLSEKELAGAWRRICGAMIIQGAVATCIAPTANERNRNRPADRHERDTACGWVDGADAIVTFEEAAETLGLNAECLRRSMKNTDVQAAARRLRRVQSGRSFVGSSKGRTTKHTVATPTAEERNELLRQRQAGAAA